MGPSAEAQEVTVVDVIGMSIVTPGVVLGVTWVELVYLSVFINGNNTHEVKHSSFS